MDINIKNIDKEIAQKLSQMANDRQIRSRSQFLSQLLTRLANSSTAIIELSSYLKEQVMARIEKLYPVDMAIEQVCNQDLERYYLLLARARFSIEPFTYREAVLLANVFNGTLCDFQICPRQHILLNVYDHLEFYPDAHELEDVEAFRQKLKDLSLLQAAWLVDALERFWNTTETNYRDSEETKYALVECGITTQESAEEFYAQIED